MEHYNIQSYIISNGPLNIIQIPIQNPKNHSKIYSILYHISHIPLMNGFTAASPCRTVLHRAVPRAAVTLLVAALDPTEGSDAPRRGLPWHHGFPSEMVGLGQLRSSKIMVNPMFVCVFFPAGWWWWLVHNFYFPMYWESSFNWLIFFRGVGISPTSLVIPY